MNRIARWAELSRFLLRRHSSGIVAPTEAEMEPALLETLDMLLATSALYLEFGSGGSTIHAGRAGIPTISVESDPYFANAMRAATANFPNVMLLHADIGLTGQRGFPLIKRATPRRIDKWRSYIRQPFEHLSRQGRFPDLILVDGRFRRACALESARQALLTGATANLLFDDYRDRPNYHRVEPFLGTPIAVGRAALFRIAPGMTRPIDEAEISGALLEME